MMSFPSKENKGKSEEASDFDGGTEGEDRGLAYAVEVLRALKPRDIMQCNMAAKRQASVPPGAATTATTTDSTTRNDHHDDDAAAPRLSITLQGLYPMQKRLDKTTVLYAPPIDPDGTLQVFAEAVRGVFQDAGLLVVDDRPLRLHATIVNTIYIKGRNNANKKQGPRGKREINDIKNVQGMLGRYEEHLWVQDMPLDRVSICRMAAKPVVVDGEVVDARYEVEAENEF
jgi:activating signal cointegrator complex subunit 1